MSEDDIYINPSLYPMLGTLSHTYGFPTEDQVLELYSVFRLQSADELVSMILTNPFVFGYVDIIRNAISGMDAKDVFLVLIQFLDRNYPQLMVNINSSDADLMLFISLVKSLVRELNQPVA